MGIKRVRKSWRLFRFTRGSTPAIIINGQSNASSGTPQAVGLNPTSRHLGPDLLGFDNATQQFETLVEGHASSRSALYTGSYGPGAGQIGTILMRRLADEFATTIRSYCLAYSGQGISYFLPASGTNAFFSDGSQHGSLNNYDLLKDYVDTAGVIPQLYVWCQGEADAGRTQAEYYADLRTLFDQTRIDYPGIKWLIIGTIGNDETDRIGQPITGVRLAQKQLADEFPDDVIFVDNRDMSYSTAYFRANHYTHFLGYREAGERAYAATRGETRPDVEAGIMDPLDIIAWNNFFRDSVSIASAPTVNGWQSDISPNPLLTTPTNAPDLIPYDPDFNNQRSIQFDRGNTETLRLSNAVSSTADATLFCVAKVDDLSSLPQYMMMLQDAGSANRLGLVGAGGSNAILAFYDGGSSSFTPNPFVQDDTAAHSYMLVHDATAQTMTLYVDGVLFGVYNTAGTEAAMVDFWIASIIGTNTVDGRYACAGVSTALATADDAAAMHDWARVKYGLAVKRAA